MKAENFTAKVKKVHGFTLLELMISLTIMSLIILIVFGSFRIGIRAWEKGERDLETQQRLRTVFGLIKMQLSSACLPGNKPEDIKDSLLKGDSKSLRITSRIAVSPANGYGMVYAYYSVNSGSGDDKESLGFYEKNIVFISDWKSVDYPGEDDLVELLYGFYSIRFEYLIPGDDEGDEEWKETWDSEEDGGLPKAIRITLMQDAERPPVSLIAGIGYGAGG
ncbi:MAG: type II secretion system protein [Deltaproteobacteria bacterium]|nr:type II secretion system protein [Deltaproteobacteria bacterium]